MRRLSRYRSRLGLREIGVSVPPITVDLLIAAQSVTIAGQQVEMQ